MGCRLLYFSVIFGTEYFTVLIIFSKIKNTISSLFRKRWIKRITPDGTFSFVEIMTHRLFLAKETSAKIEIIESTSHVHCCHWISF